MAIEIMNAARKRAVGIYSLLPLLAILSAVGYHLQAFENEIESRSMQNHIALATETYRHFGMLVLFYGIASVTCLAVLLYFIVHLLRRRDMPPGSKLFWVVVLTMFMPLSFPVFWYTMIRREPERLDVYPEL